MNITFSCDILSFNKFPVSINRWRRLVIWVIVNPDRINIWIWASKRWFQLIINFFEPNPSLSTGPILTQGETTPTICDNLLLKLLKSTCCWPVWNMLNVTFSCYVFARNFCPPWRSIWYRGYQLFSDISSDPNTFCIWIWFCIVTVEIIVHFLKPYSTCSTTPSWLSKGETTPIILYSQLFKLFMCVGSSSIGQMMNVFLASNILIEYFCPSSFKRATIYPNRFNTVVSI